ncbi:TrbI/VirB10 family protein [Calothrix sp. FACHB-1219]|uniref:TrbI/VirB10 family protein n=1 Tax=unclassified Calothrix TaxID=2619626 RepID=UPI00168722AF|nr:MULTISPECIES: TrbI/VirB10 family protein [unclassified Calothrix]MBD2202152.1 TrbI/VirB10 family protein [Calothrix sp. FACHB-168]MBD2217186.1 TrbI/VirB10 family protein [Calothrix sp. FACHB-1219]
MTRYSSSTKISLNDDSQLEIDSQDWELRMAKLVGLDNGEFSFDRDDTIEESVNESANLEPSFSQPSEVKTEQSFASNPFAKLGLVGTATFAVALCAGGFLTQLMSSNNQKAKKKNIASPVKTPLLDESQPKELEIETLKTKLALTEQAEAVQLAQKQLRNIQNQPPNQPLSTVAQSTATTSNVPKIMTVERMVDLPTPSQTPIASQPLPVPQPPQIVAVKPDIPPAVKATPQPKLDPFQMWNNLAKLGSYGQVPVRDIASANINTPTASNPHPEQQANNPAAASTPESQTTASETDNSTLIANKEAKSSKSLAVGTSAKAVLATAVFGETANASANNSDNEGESAKNTFVVRVQEPLKGVDGSVAIPAGTELLTEISSLSEQGLVQLKVVKAIAKDSNGITENSLPPNAIVIRGTQGRPLVAKQYPNRGSSIAGMDIGLFVLGGLGKAAELMNRTDSQVVSTSAGSTVVTTNNPQRNMIAAALEGGMNTVVPQIAQRNQQAISEMMQRTNVWFLPAGTEVEIYINQTMEF